MMNKPPPFKGLNIRIRVPIKGSGFVNQGFGLIAWAPVLDRWPSPVLRWNKFEALAVILQQVACNV